MERSDPERPRLIIPAATFSSMMAHCRADYPNEACGILAGCDLMVDEIFPMTNIEKSPASFLMDAEEQFRMMKELREKSLQMTAIYHSHPATPAYPSRKDLDMAYYEEAAYVIISLTEREPVVRCFSIINGKALEIGISVVA